MKTVIHWFRRDLRLDDNTALHAATKHADRVVPVFIQSAWKKQHDWTGPPRQQFLCGCVESLARAIENVGGRLIVRQGDADVQLLEAVQESEADAIFFNRDPDPFGREMERRVEIVAARLGVKVFAHQDVAIHERDEVLTGQGTPFRVFTPYSRAWRVLPKPEGVARVSKLATPPEIKSKPLPRLSDWGLEPDAEIIEPGEAAARKRLSRFLAGPILRYGEQRNFPAGATTSRLSQDLRFGTLPVREVYQCCVELAREVRAGERKSVETFITELIWREFYLQILWHYPGVLDQEFDPKFRGLRWEKPGPEFACWREGRTGFPIVDAAMRQLNATGFMHNRLRMIAAMFLTKDLHLDWRLGEKYFMQRLVDGEIASNNGGWQWSAGTGADAAPYFRVQNPWLQSARYDPDGVFIKQWLPELRDVAPKRLHEPPLPLERLAAGYPPPMLDHSVERDRTLEMFKSHAK